MELGLLITAMCSGIAGISVVHLTALAIDKLKWRRRYDYIIRLK